MIIINKKTITIVLQIFWSFLKISPSTFGGGYAMIPLIEKEVVKKRKWVNTEEVADIFVLAQVIPGAIAINAAIFVGHRIAGVGGAIAAMIGMLLPTSSIVIGISVLFFILHGHPAMDAALVGVRAAIVAIIAIAAVKIGKTAILDKITLTIAIITVILLFFVPIHPVLIIIGGACFGIVITKVKNKLKLKEATKSEG